MILRLDLQHSHNKGGEREVTPSINCFDSFDLLQRFVLPGLYDMTEMDLFSGVYHDIQCGAVSCPNNLLVHKVK